ncbi:hypothetical protein ACFL6C_09440 [Myxococcota bacterium]
MCGIGHACATLLTLLSLAAASLPGRAVASASMRNIQIDDGPNGDQTNPAVDVDGAGVYAVWSDDRNGSRDIFFTRSMDGGETWGANVRVDDSQLGEQESPSIAATGTGALFASWADSRNNAATAISISILPKVRTPVAVGCQISVSTMRRPKTSFLP